MQAAAKENAVTDTEKASFDPPTNRDSNDETSSKDRHNVLGDILSRPELQVPQTQLPNLEGTYLPVLELALNPEQSAQKRWQNTDQQLADAVAKADKSAADDRDDAAFRRDAYSRIFVGKYDKASARVTAMINDTVRHYSK